MKKLILIIITAFALLKGIAQPTPADLKKMSVQQKANFMTDTLKTMLSLNDAQYKNTHVLVLEAVTKAAPILQSENSRLSKGWQVKSIFEEHEKKIKLLLTANQQSLYEINKKDLIAYYKSKYR